MYKLATGLFIGLLVMLVQARDSSGAEVEEAVLAGGCFWCMEPPFEKLEGVKDVVSGYTGGHRDNPTYGEVSSGSTGHVEAVKVIYDPKEISFEKLLDVFWRQIDPTDPGGQFADRGSQYRSAIFYSTEEQKAIAEKSKEKLQKSGRFERPIVTEIIPASAFFAAEEYHQDYYRKSPLKYKFYRFNSGRDRFLKRTWGKPEASIKPGQGDECFDRPSREELKMKLTEMQYMVTQEDGTEPPFQNEYWDNKKEGIYVDIISGEPLFSSIDKYESGTGWPSFTRPLVPGNIVEKDDYKLFSKRIDVRSRLGDSHLGHVFKDGPKPTGLRYCLNSAAFRFVPREDLEEEGYGEFLKLFEGREGVGKE